MQILGQSHSDNLLVQHNSAPTQNDPQAAQGGHTDYPTESHATVAPAAPLHERWVDIPFALRERQQWCVAGPDKRPYGVGPKGLYPASVTNPATWTDFDTAAYHASLIGAHIGYVLLKGAGVSCIDIDVKAAANEPNPDKWTTPEQIARYTRIMDAFDCYTERSKSALGLHIWVLGEIGNGKRRDGVELYSQKRFIICTGDTVRPSPMRDQQYLLEVLKRELGNGRDTEALGLVELEPLEDDETVLMRASTAANADKFNALCACTSATGEGGHKVHGSYIELGYQSQSEADMALMTMFGFYSKSNEQCRRLFRMTGLGKREKATKDNRYLDATLRSARNFEAADLGGANVEHGRELVEAILKYAMRKGDIPGVFEPGDESDWIVSISDVLSNPSPEPEFLTDQLMPAGEVTLFAAHGGTGKSLLMLMWAVHAALGKPFLGKRVIQAPVIFYSAEDRGEIVRYRLGKICESLGVDPHEVAKFLTVLDGTGAPVLFEERSSGKSVRSTTTTDVYDRLKRQGDKLGARYFFIDNASDTYAADEIKRAQVQAFLRALRSLGIDRKAGVMLASHVDKHSAKGNGGGQDFSGSTQWHNSVRSRLFMTTAEDGTGLILTQGKSNHGKKSNEIQLAWNDEGLLEMVTAATRSVTDSFDTDQLLKILDDLTSKGINVPTAKGGTKTAFHVLSSHPDFPQGMAPSRMNKLVDKAAYERRIRIDHYTNANRKPATRWVRN